MQYYEINVCHGLKYLDGKHVIKIWHFLFRSNSGASVAFTPYLKSPVMIFKGCACHGYMPSLKHFPSIGRNVKTGSKAYYSVFNIY